MVNFARYMRVDEGRPSGLSWLVSRGSVTVGAVAGSYGKKRGYFSVKLEGKMYLTHRVVALLCGIVTEGEFCDPSVQIDHIDGDRTNNNPDNLRSCDHRMNQANRVSHRAGRLVGAHRHGVSGLCWHSKISIDGKSEYLGSFHTEQEAHDAYIKARGDYYGSAVQS